MSFFNSVVSAALGAVAAVANAVVSAVKSIVSAVSGKGSQDAGGMTALGAMATIADVFEDGEIDEDEEELLEEAFKLLVGAFIFPFDSGSSECNSAEEKSTIFDSVGAAVSKSWNSIKEIGHDFWSEADSRGQKAFNSGYDFANWLGCGVPDIVMETLKSNAERSEKAFDSVYDFSNWISFGNVDMVNETFNPKDPLSKEHWLNSFGTASAIFGIKETKGSVPKKSGVGVPEEFGGINKGASNPEAHNVVNYAKLKEEYKVAECANDVVDSLKSTGKLPNDYIPKEDAVNLGWKPNKALNNYAPSKKLGGDIFRNEDGILPNKQGRNWYEADVGMDYTKGRSKNPGYRVVYSNDGLIYGTYNHYETVFKIGEY